MALPAFDSFTGTTLDPISSSWTPVVNGFFINSNKCSANANLADNIAYWNADSFNADQKSQVTIAALGVGAASIGVMVRVSGTSSANLNGYLLTCNGSVAKLYKFVAGVVTELRDLSSSVTGGDVIRLEVSGTTLRGYKNGVQMGTDQTDSSLSSGAAGIYIYSNDSDLDDWTGDNVSGGGGGGGGGTSTARRALLGVGV